MTSIHFCFRRINPALSIDLCTIGTIASKEFAPLESHQFDALQSYLSRIGLPDFVRRSDISSEAYVFHGSVAVFLNLVKPTQIDWFQDTLILVIPFDFDSYEPSKEEE